jgi:hypothetical protein
MSYIYLILQNVSIPRIEMRRIAMFRFAVKKKTFARNYFRFDTEDTGKKLPGKNQIGRTVSYETAFVKRDNTTGEAISKMEIMVDTDYCETPFFKRPV